MCDSLSSQAMQVMGFRFKSICATPMATTVSSPCRRNFCTCFNAPWHSSVALCSMPLPGPAFVSELQLQTVRMRHSLRPEFGAPSACQGEAGTAAGLVRLLQAVFEDQVEDPKGLCQFASMPL